MAFPLITVLLLFYVAISIILFNINNCKRFDTIIITCLILFINCYCYLLIVLLLLC